MQNIKFVYGIAGTVAAEETLPLIARHCYVEEGDRGYYFAREHPFCGKFHPQGLYLGPTAFRRGDGFSGNNGVAFPFAGIHSGHSENCAVATDTLGCRSQMLLGKLERYKIIG